MKLAIGIVVILNAGVQALMNPLWHAFWVVMFLIALTVVPWRRWTDAQRLMRAEEAQESRRPERTGSP